MSPTDAVTAMALNIIWHLKAPSDGSVSDSRDVDCFDPRLLPFPPLPFVPFTVFLIDSFEVLGEPAFFGSGAVGCTWNFSAADVAISSLVGAGGTSTPGGTFGGGASGALGGGASCESSHFFVKFVARLNVSHCNSLNQVLRTRMHHPA